jgi:2-amino-4-hydroxy-6-hydroxymethyldihydropteridine diphosphokinase
MILIALGSNLTGPWGTPQHTLKRAIEEMRFHNIRVLRVSTVIETAPYGVTNQPNFVNAAIEITTALSPESLLRALHMIEAKAGRKRLKRWGPRTLDLDILDYHGLIRKSARTDIKPLVLPHPGIEQRSFVLKPLAEIAPRWKHPKSRQTAALTLRQLSRLNPS